MLMLMLMLIQQQQQMGEMGLDAEDRDLAETEMTTADDGHNYQYQ